MHVTSQMSFDADPVTVATMLADPSYVEAKLRASGALSHDSSVTPGDGGAFTVTTTRELSTEMVPAQFRSMIGNSITVRMVEDWAPPAALGRDGQLTVEIVGAPVRMSATVRLRPHEAGSRADVDGDLVASIPLFGAKIEQAVSEALLSGMASEERTAAEWLRDHN